MIFLFEDIKTIEEAIKFLDTKIIEFRRNYNGRDKSKIMNSLGIFHNNKISKWYDEYILSGYKLNSKIEDEIINEILDVINLLDKIENK